MNTKALERNIVKYYVLRCVVKRMVFPILTVYLLRHQLSVHEIGTVFAVCTLGIILEVPTGAFAERKTHFFLKPFAILAVKKN
jgi:hypothetical protein